VRKGAERKFNRDMPADCRPRTLDDCGKSIGIPLRDGQERLVIHGGDTFADLPAATSSVGHIGEVLAIMREIGRQDQQGLGIHQPYQRTNAHPHLVFPECTRHKRHDRKIVSKRNLQKRVLDLGGMFGLVNAVVA